MTADEFLSESPIFAGLSAAESRHLFSRLSVHSKKFVRGQTMVFQGQPPDGAGIIASGAAFEKKYFSDGTCEIVLALEKGDLFGEGAIFEKNAESGCEVCARAECEAFFLHFSRLSAICANDCALLSQLMKNIALALAQKNERLKGRLAILSQRTVRGKILAALDFFGGEIPFGIGEFADFLCADRSAVWRAARQLSASHEIRFARRS